MAQRMGYFAVIIAVAALLGGVFLGTMIAEPLAIAAGIGVLASWAVGIYVVAPRAGKIAKDRIINMVAEPSEDDQRLLANLSAHVLGNMANFAKNDETKQIFNPLFDVALDRIDERWQAIVANKASQRVKGVGDFSHSAIAESDVAKDLLGHIVTQFGDPILDAFGVEGESRKVAQAVFLSKFAGAGGGNSGQGATDTPSYIAGGR